MYSTVTFEGNLAADVEVKENKAGGVYVDAVVLVNQGKEADGSDRTPTRWQVRITGRTAENAANLRKGDRLLVTGSVVTDSWADKADRRGAVRHPGAGPVRRGLVDVRPGHRHRAQHPHRRLTHLPGSRSPRGRDPTSTQLTTRPTESRNPPT